MDVKISIPETLSPTLLAYLDTLDDMTQVNEAVATDERVLFRDHLAFAAITRHKWANRLGATPTGHLKDAYESVKADHDASGAFVEIESPGITRAFHELNIVPRTAAFLTIPAHASSYGKRVADMSVKMFRPVAKGGKKKSGPFRNFLASTDGGEFRILYWLKKSVTVPQDRELLPSDDDIVATAKDAITTQLRRKAQEAKKQGL